MYARIGGIPEENIQSEVDNLLRLLLMEHCADKIVNTLRYRSMLKSYLRIGKWKRHAMQMGNV